MADDFSQHYYASGVNTRATDKFVNHLTQTKLTGPASAAILPPAAFAAGFDIAALAESGLTQPVLLAATDGVGTKLILATQHDQYAGIGQDVVAMCVNDILAHGGLPIFFLDYLACAKFNSATALAIINGITDACKRCGCQLIGGETAELPGLLQPAMFDVAGFAVGVADHKLLWQAKNVQPGDQLLALPASGLHANGFSLVRRIITQHQIALDNQLPELNGVTTLEALLTATKLYVPTLRQLIKQQTQPIIQAAAHITGGGLKANLVRAIPANCQAEISRQSWDVPHLYSWLSELAGIPWDEAAQVWNMGIGFILIVRAHDCAVVQDSIKAAGEQSFVIGEVTRRAGKEAVIIN